ncbi:MerR family transcriptional regulator [Variovorax paradoxus]|jgi:DNA-binding transcriptional MerR regulator|uniref:MerR family transcriptional regulator n=1 Tax=Variovorax paradoxus TaxID=34073 RepID=UPI0024811B18|nr:MerR family transcriptional regulator [Variovorax paradoxus]WGT62830.1 MerR family transcriptional regulator [Variovorax paradoxus]
MRIKVGDLARSTGLTVRTLHHYDEIGLLKPSGRSDSGYRLYSEGDVARLHAIQALRHLGLALAEIGPLLDGSEAAPERVIEQQMHALDHQIRQATELRERLALMHGMLRKGGSPSMDDWVQTLSLMTTFGRYFEAGELKQILGAYVGVEQDWLQLQAEVRRYMDTGGGIDTWECQVLTRRWTMLMVRWMGGNYALMERWGAMFRQESKVRGQGGAPPTDMMEFMESAIQLRVRLMQEHCGSVEFRLPPMPDAEAQAIDAEGRALLRAGERRDGAKARALRKRWAALLHKTCGGNTALFAKLATLHLGHPLLLAGLPLGREVREFLSPVDESA